MSSRAAKHAEARKAENHRTELSLTALIHPLEKVIASDSRGAAALGELRKQRFDAVAAGPARLFGSTRRRPCGTASDDLSPSERRLPAKVVEHR